MEWFFGGPFPNVMGEAVISNVLMRLAKWPQSSHINDWVDIMESYLEYYK